jgi:hypothetical protein
MKRTAAFATLAMAVTGGIVGLASSPAQAAVPSCVGKRSTGYVYSVYVDNACSTTQRVKVDWGYLAPNSSCRTLAPRTTQTISASGLWKAVSQYEGLISC